MTDRDLAITLRAIIAPLQAGLAQAGAAVKTFATETNAQLQTVEKESKGLNETWNKLFKAMIGVEIINQLKNLALEASNANEVLDVAANTAHNLGKAFDEAKIDQWAKQFSRSLEGGGYALAQVTEGIGQFVAVGASGAQAQRLMADSAALAAGRHLELSEAVHIVQMAATGHIALLSRYGIQVKDAAGKTLDFQQVMEKLEQTFKGDAAERAASLAGQLGILANQFTVLKEGLGLNFLPIVNSVVGALNSLIDWFDRLSPAIQRNIALWSAAALAIVGVSLVLPALFAAFDSMIAVLTILTNPIMLVAVALIALTAVFIEASRPPGLFADAVRDGLQGAGNVIHTFVEFCRNEFDSIKFFFESLGDMATGNIAGAVSSMRLALATDTVAGFKARLDTQDALGHVENAKDRIVKSFKDMVGGLGAAFTAHVTVPNAPLTGLGGPEKGGKTKDTSAPVAENRLKNFEDDQKSTLDEFAQSVERAKTNFDLAKTNLENYKAKYGDKPQTQQQLDTQQKLIHEETQKELNVRQAIKAEMQAQIRAAASIEQYGTHVSKELKNHDQLVRQIDAAMRSHLDTAGKLNVEFISLGGSIATLAKAWKTAGTELDAYLAKTQKEAADKRGYGISLGDKSREEDTRLRRGLADAGGKVSQADTARFDVQMANDAKVAADHAVALARDTLAIDKRNKQDTTADTKALDTALYGARVATDNVTIAQAKLTEALEAGKTGFTKLLDGLVAKAAVPGLGVNADTGHMAFSWIGFLTQAVEQTKAYAEIHQTVNAIMKVVAQALDALHPVIHVLMTIVVDVVNVFIGLWNIIARILRLFGLHVALLDRVNTALNDVTAPLIRFVHDIPTLNELAGKVPMGALGPDQTTFATNINQPIVDSITDAKGGIIDVLLKILAALVAYGAISALFGGGGGGGGIVGTIIGWGAKLFGGGSAAAAALPTVAAGFSGSAAGLVANADGSYTAPMMGAGGHTGLLGGMESKIGTGFEKVFGPGGFMSKTTFGAGTIGSALIGIAAGQVFGAMMGGGSHSDWGSIGGAIGSVIPGVGTIVGALSGALLGSLFGHADNKALMPDKYAAGYGQDMANIQGSGFGGLGQMTANGQQFTEDSGLRQQLGGQSMLGFIEAYIKSSGTKVLTAAEAALFKGVTLGAGGSGGITGGKDGNLTLSNGQTVNWSTLLSSASDAIQRIMAAGANAAAGGLAAGGTAIQQNLSAAGNDLAAQVTAVQSATAASISDLRKVIAPLTGGGVSTGGGPRLAGGIAGVQPAGTTVHQSTHIHGDVNGIAELEDIFKAQADATSRAIRTRSYQLDRVA